MAIVTGDPKSRARGWWQTKTITRICKKVQISAQENRFAPFRAVHGVALASYSKPPASSTGLHQASKHVTALPSRSLYCNTSKLAGNILAMFTGQNPKPWVISFIARSVRTATDLMTTVHSWKPPCCRQKLASQLEMQLWQRSCCQQAARLKTEAWSWVSGSSMQSATRRPGCEVGTW